jgi:PAS domain S-box-containing protein
MGYPLPGQCRFLIIILLVMLSLYSQANPVVVISHPHSHRLSSEVDFLFDKSLKLPLNEAINSSDWAPITGKSINFSFRPEAVWLRFSIHVTHTDEYIVHIPYPLIDHLDNYSFINNKALPPILTGDARNFNTRKTNHIDFVFPYSLNQGDILTVYLRAATNGALDIPIDVISQKVFNENEYKNTFFRGFVSGILWLMLLYNFFIYAAIKDRVYLFYVIHIFACMVASYAYDGAAFQYVWPNNPELNDFIFPIFNGLIQATSILFMLTLLQVLDTKTWYRSYFLGLLAIVSFFPILGAILPYSIIVPIEVVFSLLVNASAFLLGLHLSIKGNKSAQYFTVAVALFMVGLVSSNLKSLGFLPNNFFTQHAYQLGFFIQMVVLSLALAQKIDATKKILILAQNDNIKNLKRYKELYSESVSGNFQIHLSGKVMSVNRAFSEILGFSSIYHLMNSDISNNITAIAVNQNSIDNIMTIMKKDGGLIDFEDKVKHLTGKAVWVSLSMRPVLSHDNEIEYFEGSMIDISGRKENEHLKEQALKDKMHSLELLIIGICHELNTPLGLSITGLSHIKDLIKNLSHAYEDKQLTRAIFQDILSEEVESIELTEENLIRIRTLLRQFKHISVSQLDYPLSNASLLNTLEQGIEQNKTSIENMGVNITIDCPTDLELFSYHQAISEVINQLTSNSLDHGFTNNEVHNICIYASNNQGRIVIAYQDNGSGLSPEGKDELFNPFYTTMRGSQGKIGLGMYLTYNIITQLLNGDIEISTSTHGLCLKISFPTQVS